MLLASFLSRQCFLIADESTASDAQDELNQLSLLKNLLLQMLERSVGDTHLFEKLVGAFQEHQKDHKDETLLNDLWNALRSGFETLNHKSVHLVILIDGADQLTKQHAQHDLHKRLYDCVDNLDTVRVVVTSANNHSVAKTGCYHFDVKAEDLEDDLEMYFRRQLSKNSHYHNFSNDAQGSLVTKLIKHSHGSFLWAKLASLRLRKHSGDNLRQAGETIPTDIQALIKQIVEGIDLKNEITKRLIEFMLVAQRPLTVTEMTDLLRVNVGKRSMNSNIHLTAHIDSHCSAFVVERKGLLRFGHSIIRKYFHDMLGKSLATSMDVTREFTLRILLYSRLHLSTSIEPTFDGLSDDALEQTFRSYPLIRYVVCYWTAHFETCGYKDVSGKITLPGHFKDCFPDSAMFALVEWGYWHGQYSLARTIKHKEFALRIRMLSFGENHRAVMQSMIIVGILYKSTTEMTRAAEFFYQASRIGQVVLQKFSTVVVTCTTTFLTCTEALTITERTEIVTYRETMIKFMIEICKVKHGATSDAVIRWYRILAKLYVDIKEEHHASVLYKELYEIIIIRFGKGSREASDVSQVISGLKIVFHGERSETDVIRYREWIFETSDEMDTTDELRISIILELIYSYESSRQWMLAEKLFISLWCRISEICRIKATLEMHRLKIDIAIKYIQFLHRLKRVEEATNILICLWAEYEHHSTESEIIIIRIKEIGILFRSFGLLSVAVSVFAKVWGWFKSHGKSHHEEASSTTILITEVVQEITETTTITKTKTTTVTTETETVTREIFETTYERCKHSKVDHHFFKSCIALISLYVTQQKWSEAEIVIKKSLELTWKAVLTVDAKLTLTETYVSECIHVAMQLAICYHRQSYFEKAEAIYLRLYRACLVSLHAEHESLTVVSMALIRFYEEYHRHDKVVEIYVELLQVYRKQLGASHRLTIKTLYALGAVCMILGRKDAYQYYIEIVTTLNKGGHCPHDAFEAAIIVCRYYYEEKRWTELQSICAVLWQTFIHHHHEYKFTEEMIQVIYERYVYVLEFHAKVEFSVIYKLTVEYRETVTKVFGLTALIVIKAMIELAKICEKHESHYHESVTIYEEVIMRIKKTTTITTVETETITKTVKKRLSTVYVTIITSGSSSTTTTVERALTICLEVYAQLKIEFGCWHETTLAKLKEIVILYKKSSTHESHLKIVRLLQTSIIEIITTVTTSMSLYTAALTIALIYVTVDMISQGEELLHQLHHLLILKEMGYSGELTITLDSKVSATAFVFLVAFERSLTRKVVLSYSELMIDIVTEKFLYEQYISSTRTESTKFEFILECGAKLRSFWDVRSKKTLVAGLDKKLFEMFKGKYGSAIKTRDEFTFVFYVTILHELSKDRSKIDFEAIVCHSSNAKVRALLEAGEFNQAHEVAKCSFQFINSQKIYEHHRCISYGYKLAELLAGIDVRKPTDTKTRESMLETSRVVLKTVLEVFRAMKMDFVSLKFEDIQGLVRLLGDQQNYGELAVSQIPPLLPQAPLDSILTDSSLLQHLLESLWQSREVQKTWSPDTVLSIGRCLVHARHGNGQIRSAIELCDTLCYNLRRSRGWLDKDALEMVELLTQLYTANNQHAEVMRVHEEVLREIDENDDDGYVDRANVHFKLLRAAFLRLGRWERSERTYKELYGRLKRYRGLEPGAAPEKWAGAGGAGGKEHGVYHLPKEWRLVAAGEKSVRDEKSRKTMFRAASGRNSLLF